MTTKIKITDSLLEIFGTGSLTASLMNKSGELPNEAVLQVPWTSLQWRGKNGGPRTIIITENTVLCLIEDLLSLAERGVKLSVEKLPEDP